MLSLKQIIGKSLIGAMLLGGLAAGSARAELSVEEINSIARQTTVLIAPGLTEDLLEDLENNRNNPLASEKNPDGLWNPGSGAIVAREGKTYFVLTVTHNFKQKHLDQELSYGIRTSDGIVHEVKTINDGRGCPLTGTLTLGTLFRFGCYSRNVPGRVAGVDLAVVSFQSDRNYPLAPLGDPDLVNPGDRVYISGWPDPEKERDANGKCRGKVERRQRRLSWGPVASKINPSQGEYGYSIFYFDSTRAGMSGGPVLDANGRIVGVHGRGSGDKGQLLKKHCSISAAPQNALLESADLADLLGSDSAPAPTDTKTLHSRYSSSQNVNFFLELIAEASIDMAFNRQSLLVAKVGDLTSGFDEPNAKTGILDIPAREDVIGSFDDPNDVVEDIYELYSFGIKNMMRDEPSGGAGSLLLGD
ncbi:MAG: trypsin-like peptidase domain-containing protein [Oscillatoria sp. SIO1A7]|nr:trypsin-like peptidase domain-containing protein [Oscillatoria sp. SIO1A7]